MPKKKPKQVVYVDGFPTITPDEMNRHGTRFQTPDTGKKIVVCTGCSHTFGMTGPKKSWPFFLGKHMGKGYQVLNMARRNYSLKLNVDWYNFYARKLKPHMCIMQIPNFTRQPFPNKQPNKVIHYTAKYGVLDVHQKRKVVSDNEFRAMVPKLIGRELTRLRRHLVSLLDDGVVPVVVLYYTFDYMPELTYQYIDQCHDQIEELCRELKVCLCRDPENLSRNNFESKKWMHTDKAHPGTRGNEFIASFVHDNIKGKL